jgi:guanylate kinase
VTRKRGLLVVIAGPSGVGKGTVHTRVRDALPDSILSISATTRLPRAGEVDDVDYRFVDREEFDQLVGNNELYEWAEYAGHSYGTPRRPAKEAVTRGQVVVLDIELQGALQIKEQDPDALLIFLVPPSFEELERRLRGRGTEDDAAVARRLERAREELAEGDRFDVRIVNDDLDRCVEEVLAVIEDARLQPPHHPWDT